MQYEFDKIIQRKGTHSLKWEYFHSMFNVSEDQELLPLWVADMDFESPQPVLDAVRKRAEHGIFGYSSPGNDYFDSVINWMGRRHHWDIKKEWIVVTSGVVPALSCCVQTFTNPGDKIIIQRPVYYPFTSVTVNNGRLVSNNKLIYENNRYTIDFDDLEMKARDPLAKLMILCSPHNPVGRVWNKEELTRIGQICLENNVILVSDEIHGDLILAGHIHHPMISLAKDFEKSLLFVQRPAKLLTWPVCTRPTLSFPMKN